MRRPCTWDSPPSWPGQLLERDCLEGDFETEAPGHEGPRLPQTGNCSERGAPQTKNPLLRPQAEGAPTYRAYPGDMGQLKFTLLYSLKPTSPSLP